MQVKPEIKKKTEFTRNHHWIRIFETFSAPTITRCEGEVLFWTSDHGAQKKDQKHSHYLTEGNAIGFAFDSMGGISQSAMKFINHLYAKGRGNRKRSWDSEAMRVALRKEFLDRLSMVLCSHRVRDFRFLGIPYVRANGATIYNSAPRSRLPRTPPTLPHQLNPGRFTISRPVGPG